MTGNPHGIPVVRLELQGMKESILHAFSEYQLQMDEQVRAALDKALNPENLQRVIAFEVNRALEGVIREEVERFYRYGSGRQVVRDAVNQRLADT